MRTRLVWKACVGWLVSVLVIAACASATEPAAPLPQPEPAPEPIAVRSEIEEALRRLRAYDRLQVAAGLGLSPSFERMRSGALAGRLTIDRRVLEECLADATFISFEAEPSPESPCSNLWIPLTPPGEPCDTDVACIDGYCSREDYTRSRPHYVMGGCGVCAPRNALGETCPRLGWTGEERNCVAGLVCRCPDADYSCEIEVPKTCQQLVLGRANDACRNDDECDASTWCKNRVCTTKGSRGANCVWGTECQDGYCVDGLCGARGLGEACAGADECAPNLSCTDNVCARSFVGSSCYRGCSDPLVCVYTPSGGSFCRAPANNGDPCTGDDECIGANRCIDDVCRRWLPPGDACAPDGIDRCMRGTRCVDARCESLPTVGEPCSDTCGTGTCIDGLCTAQAGDMCTHNGHGDDDGIPSYGPCGDALICGDLMGGNTCVIGGTAGAVCNVDDYLGCANRHYCNKDNLCEPVCILDATPLL